MQKNLLIIGGTGLVGSTIERIFSERNPKSNIFIGTRTPTTTNEIRIDVNVPETLNALPSLAIDLIILSVNDTNDVVLQFAITHGINYIDLTKPTPDLTKAYRYAQNQNLRSKIVFGSGWMGGTIPSLIQAVVPKKETIKSTAIRVYYSTKDKAGASSAHFMAENVAKPFVNYQNNKPNSVLHFKNTTYHSFGFGLGKRQVYNFDIPDLYILNQIENIPNVEVKMTYDSKLITWLLGAMQDIRLFDILSLEQRRNVFGSSGNGDLAVFEVLVKTNNHTALIQVASALGQAELTAFSTVLHIEEMLYREHKPNVYFAHQLHQSEVLVAAMQKNSTLTIKTKKV